MKSNISIRFVHIVFILMVTSFSYNYANAIPIIGNYSLADGVYREVLISGSAGQLSNLLHFHDGLLSTDPGYDGWDYYIGDYFVLSEATTLVESGADYDIFKTHFTAGDFNVDGEIWGESNNSFYNVLNASAELSSTVYSNGSVTMDLLVFGVIDGYSNYTALFNAKLNETGFEPWLGNNSVVGTLHDVDLEITTIPEPASLGLLGLVAGAIYFIRRFFAV